jgi:isochorismate hydrolase
LKELVGVIGLRHYHAIKGDEKKVENARVRIVNIALKIEKQVAVLEKWMGGIEVILKGIEPEIDETRREILKTGAKVLAGGAFGLPWSPLRFTPKETALLVIDVFEGVTYAGRKAQYEIMEEVGNIKNVIDYANTKGWHKFAPLHPYHDFGPENHLKIALKKAMVAGGKQPHYMEKSGNSFFTNQNLDVMLKARNVERIVLTGLNAGACVLDTAKDALSKGYEVVTARDMIMPDYIFENNRPEARFYRENTIFFETHQEMLDFLR